MYFYLFPTASLDGRKVINIEVHIDHSEVYTAVTRSRLFRALIHGITVRHVSLSSSTRTSASYEVGPYQARKS